MLENSTIMSNGGEIGDQLLNWHRTSKKSSFYKNS